MGYQLILNISYKLNRTYRTILLYTADGNYNHERHYPGDSRHFASADHDSDHRIHVGILPAGGEQAQQPAAGQANKALQTAEIVDVSNGKVTIKNVGTEPISTANVQIFVDGDPAAITPVGDAENI